MVLPFKIQVLLDIQMFLNGTQIKDKSSTKSILDSLNMLSFNQMNAQIKLTEAWKISNIPNYPTKWELKTTQEDERTTRATSFQKQPKPRWHRQLMTMMQKNSGLELQLTLKIQNPLILPKRLSKFM